MNFPVNLLDRPMYGFSQVDHLLGLGTGTARRWINGYDRGGQAYQPIIRQRSTKSEIVTWGEFVEARCLSEFRGQGVKVNQLRGVIKRLRTRTDTRYPLAHAYSLLSVQGREIVEQVQNEVDLDGSVRLVVVRNSQLILTSRALAFTEATDFGDGPNQDKTALRIFPQHGNKSVVVDPNFGFGEPVVRSIRTELIAEQFSAGDGVGEIAEWFQLEQSQVEAAIRFELFRRKHDSVAA